MINIDQPKFDGCRRIYMAANTPTFLVKKLRIERSVLDLHLRYSKEQLIEMLRESIAKPLQNFDDKVLPMILLAALSFKGDPKVFAEFESYVDRRWISAVARYLRKFVRPTKNESIDFRSSELASARAQNKRRASNSRQLLEI